MKKALVFSDSHGRLDNLLDVMKQYTDFEAVYHTEKYLLLQGA